MVRGEVRVPEERLVAGPGQYCLHSERGRAGLEKDRRDSCRLLWRLWPPPGHLRIPRFEKTAEAFDNLDFVSVVTHSYRQR